MSLLKDVPKVWGYKEKMWFLDQQLTLPAYILGSAGITFPDPRYHIIRLQGVNYFVFEHVISGNGTLRVENQIFHPRAGDCYILPPDTAVEYWSNPEDPWQKLWINISGNLPAALIESYSLQNTILFRNCPLQKEFEDIMHLLSSPPDDAADKLAFHLHSIIASLSRHRMNLTFEQSSRSGVILRNYIHEHWNEHLTLTDLAKFISRTPEQTVRIFKKEYGVTPMNYLQQYRLEFAKQYLHNTRYTLRMIAAELGFSNAYYFAAWFKKLTGVSPGRFRDGK
ncbi:MAG: helix-turn-helix domain-containing protein [Lentisphaeria bacterium]|nr:helix-turn-helix domain-containing protein [Lentisphaeria bacterium]